MQYAVLQLQNIFTEISDCQQKQILIAIFFLAIMATILFLFQICNSRQNKRNRKKLILIGTSGEEKTKIFNLVAEKNIKSQAIKLDIDQFQEFSIGNNLDLVNSPFSIEKDVSKEQIEETIYQLTIYYKQNINDIQRLYLVVNFEQIINMKEYFLEDAQHFKKFSNLIDIFVTNFQLSQDQIHDKENLVKAFHHLNYNKSKVHFIRDDIKIEELQQLLIQSANQFDYKDTLFEDVDEIEIEHLTNLLANGKRYQNIQIQS
ncbi:unnamed protein product (macronuclear) [Paramecium tetraurelia]|uniref:Signal recognition particle receptor subunit beta n=1 Tax=Paramecium tetraurelia TaxID=5888 RepID=A0E185_PARTE|nr:uncharacterized protein GSPATT00022221001 [Paramecium tetraurelia]CAK89052.1 unnamed protein product [Paramecium tetraurelia]|eukprot:XP_001456449.1 hypothetical protein (macronuclear) [Paramecium tetraurelia strain d4-2]